MPVVVEPVFPRCRTLTEVLRVLEVVVVEVLLGGGLAVALLRCLAVLHVALVPAAAVAALGLDGERRSGQLEPPAGLHRVVELVALVRACGVERCGGAVEGRF